MKTKENEQDMHDDDVDDDDLEKIQIGFCKIWSCGNIMLYVTHVVQYPVSRNYIMSLIFSRILWVCWFFFAY